MGPRVVRPRITLGRSDLRRSVAVVAALGLLWLAGAPAAARAGSPDRAATHTYLQAVYSLSVAMARNVPAGTAAQTRAGRAIAAECPKVLAGAPGGPNASVSIGSSSPTQPNSTPRAQGESDRESHQFSVLSDELETTLRAEAFKLDVAVLAKFVQTVSPLRWSDPAIAPSIQDEISILKLLVEPGPPAAVCADMRFWVASGYRRLSPGTLAFEAPQEGLLGTILASGATNPETALKRYEGPRERALAKRTRALGSGHAFDLGGSNTESPVRRALGIETASSPPGEHKPTVIGHGRTRAGGNFEIEVTRGPGASCRHMISASYTVTFAEGSSSSATGSSLRCLSGGVPRAHPEVRCDAGAIEVESTTLAATRDVRLTLSDGRTVTSSVIPVAKRYGGPAGAYFQAVRGPSPYPVSLSELDASATVLRTVALRALRNCRPPKRTPPSSPIVRDVAHGTTPAGRSFTIIAGSGLRKGKRSVSFLVSGLGFAGVEESLPASPGPGAGASYIPWALSVGCQRQTESVIYGQLEVPGTTVLVATATTPLTALTEVPLPAALKVPGTLAYAVLSGLPSELVVRDAAGATLLKEDLTARARKDAEYCEGYVEPPA